MTWMIDRKGIAGNQATGLLKLIALVCMIIDHLGAAVYPNHMELRVIGRIAFPLYAWCLAVGACRTRCMWKYLLRLLAVGAVSQPLYMLVLNHTWDQLNIFFTLALGLCGIWGIRAKKWGSQVWAPVLAMGAATLLTVDYGWKGVALPILLYLLRWNRWLLAAGMAAFCYFWAPESRSVAYLFGVRIYPMKQPVLFDLVMPWFRMQSLAVLSLPLMLIRFPWKVRMPVWLSYAIYPAHLILIYVLKQVL